MGDEGGAQDGKLPVSLEPSEALGGFEHAGGDPAQRHLRVPPALHVARDASDRAHHVLGDVGAGERAAQLGRQLQPNDGEDFVDPLQDAGGGAGPVLFEPARQIADQPLGLDRIVEFPSLPQDPAGRGVHLLRQPVHDVPRLVDLASLDRGGLAEGRPDRLRQRFRAIDDEEARNRRIETAVDEVVQKRLDGRGILGGAFHDRQRMLAAIAVDADRRDQHEVVANMQPVDLNDQETSPDRSALMKSPSFSVDSATKRREAADFETPLPGPAATSPSGSRTARPNRRVETLISIRFIAQRPSQSSAVA